MSQVTVTHCDSAECSNTRLHDAHGWVSVSQGASHNDFCSWSCVSNFADARWEPGRRSSDRKKPKHDPHYLCDAVQVPLPEVAE